MHIYTKDKKNKINGYTCIHVDLVIQQNRWITIRKKKERFPDLLMGNAMMD